MKTKKPKTWMNAEQLGEATECLKAMAHPVRLQILQMLLAGKYTVGELAQACTVLPSVASTQVRLMERCGLLVGNRDGKRVYYEIAESHLAGIMACLEGRFAR